ncbi:MAG: hypothetical protein ACKO9B_10065 [Planctomycetota bacterium]
MPCPPRQRRSFRGDRPGRCRALPAVATLIAALTALAPASADEPGAVAPPVTVRITWGGGRPRGWSGTVRVLAPTGQVLPLPAWRPLAADPEAVARIHPRDGHLQVVAGGERVVLDGVEIAIPDWATARIEVALAADGAATPVTTTVAVSDLLGSPALEPLDAEANRLSLDRAGGDELRVVFPAPGPGTVPDAPLPTLRRPGDTVRFEVHPLLAGRPAGSTSVELRARVVASDDGESHATQAVLLREIAADGARAFEPVPVELALPVREGAYDIVLEVVERSGLRWSRPIATRTVQCVAVSTAAPVSPIAEWKKVCEVDPGSPRLLERLRRLPGVKVPAVVPANLPLAGGAMGRVPLPSLPLPLPKLPAVGEMVPKFTGLLAVGDSTLVPHPAGAMLSLPPAPGAGQVSWEGIAVAGLQPAHPHVVEVEYPIDQDAMVGITVLEQVGTEVRATAAGGFVVERPLATRSHPVAEGIATHRFVFWPHTRAGVVVLSNAAQRTPLHIGRVRVLSGPQRLPPAPSAGAGEARRKLFAFLPEPDFERFGGVRRVDGATGRGVDDWHGLLVGCRSLAEWLAAQGADGAVVTVAADGGAVWPSATLGTAPRWDGGGSFTGRLDPVPKDALALACRLFARERLGLVPAIAGTGPLPVIEALLAEGAGDPTGLVCIGADGRPRRGPGVAGRYNILDPRVQDACAEVVGELAARLRGEPAVEGLALVMPHDGWLHLPGVATALDDATFRRFLAAAGPVAAGLEPVAAPGPERFARRAALVEGPLREPWLEWRAAEVARFHHRLADIVRSVDPDWTLTLVPTTLFSAGDLAARFRALVSTAAAEGDLAREAGLDLARLAAHGSIVVGIPHVTAATADIVEAGIVERANRAVAPGPPAARRAAVLVSQPRSLDLGTAVQHMPLRGDAPESIDCRAVLAGAAARRPSAAVFAGGDVVLVIDESLSTVSADEIQSRTRRARAALPAVPMTAIPRAAAPLAAFAGAADDATWVSLVNRCGEPCTAQLVAAETVPSADEPATGAALASDGRSLAVPLAPWEERSVRFAGPVRFDRVDALLDPVVAGVVDDLVAGLRRRRAVLETPFPLPVLDNPAFEQPELGDRVAGWELLEPQRGTLRGVAPGAGGEGRAAEFATVTGLATLRSNPFPAPATGRISVAVWLRIPTESTQPPLRIALEGLEGGREYYRFAPVGMAPGAMPLSRSWSQFVLQVDDLPTAGLESLRVRLDLLGPGAVEIDDVRVFDLAFDESQRVQITKLLALVDHHRGETDLGRCLLELDEPWARFLLAFVVPAAEPPVAGAVPAVPAAPGPATTGTPRPKERTARQPAPAGIIDRFRQWWQ